MVTPPYLYKCVHRRLCGHVLAQALQGFRVRCGVGGRQRRGVDVRAATRSQRLLQSSTSRCPRLTPLLRGTLDVCNFPFIHGSCNGCNGIFHLCASARSHFHQL